MKHLFFLISLLAILANTVVYAQRDTLKYDEIERYLYPPDSLIYFPSDSISRAYYYCVQMSPAEKCSVIAVQLRYGLINNSGQNDTLEIAIFDANVNTTPKLPCIGSYKIHLGNQSIPPGNSRNFTQSDTLTFWLPEPIIIVPKRDFIIGYKPIVSGGDILAHFGIRNSSAAWRSRRYWYERDTLQQVTAQGLSEWCYYVRAIVEYNPSLPDSVKLVHVPSENNPGSEFILYQNYPNPSNPHTNIQFQVSSFTFLSLKVYDVSGREVKSLVDEFKSPGVYQVEFDGSDLPSGIYFYQMRVAGKRPIVVTRKLVVMK